MNRVRRIKGIMQPVLPGIYPHFLTGLTNIFTQHFGSFQQVANTHEICPILPSVYYLTKQRVYTYRLLGQKT